MAKSSKQDSGGRWSLDLLRNELEDVLSRFWGPESSGGWPVPADLSETPQNVEVELDLPGINPADIDIQVQGNTLSIQGERKEPIREEEPQRDYLCVERRSGSFSRSLTLPCAVDEETATAEYRDGVLKITLPKSEQARTHKINVRG